MTNKYLRLQSLVFRIAGSLTILLIVGCIGVSGQTKLTFEDLPNGTDITRPQRYAQLGLVIEPQAVISTAPEPHSGTRVLSALGGEFYVGALVLNFTSGQSHVSFFAGATLWHPGASVTSRVRVLDENGRQIVSLPAKPVAPNQCSTEYDILVKGSLIRRIEVFVEATDAGGGKFDEPPAIDDLVFEGEPPPNFGDPVVNITAPANSAQVDAASITVQGTVTGDNLLSEGRLTLKLHEPAGRPQLPPVIKTVPLNGLGRLRTFSFPVSLNVGPCTLTFEASNSGGRSGTAKVWFVNLPRLIADVYNSGWAGRIGALNWAVRGDGCTLAVYDQGAIAAEGGRTLLVTNPIFGKWRQWILSKYQQPMSAGPFCPIEREHEASGPSRAQTFHQGRIYSFPGPKLVYVPGVFVKAIDDMGGEDANGVPLSDPSASPAAKTWLFQQFYRPDQKGLPSTLEIKGDPPNLWVERQGGDLKILRFAQLELTDTSPTLVDRLACGTTEGPCSPIPPTRPEPAFRYPSQNCPVSIFDPPEWIPIGSEYNMTTLIGFVTDRHPSGIDYTHTHAYGNDENVVVRPLAGFRHIQIGNNGDVEVEVPFQMVNYFFTRIFNSRPQPGNLYFTAGRHILDCGHRPASAEIHPPYITATIRTEKNNDGLIGPVTTAYIWIGGFYTGDPVSIELFPPPRPDPTATLVITKPYDKQAAMGLNTVFETDRDNFVSVKVSFKASPWRPTITNWGEMLWLSGRGYQGRWALGWQKQSQFQVRTLGRDWWP